MQSCSVSAFVVAPAAWLALLIAAGAIGFAAWASRRDRFTGHRSFAAYQLATLAWLVAAAGELSAVDAACKMDWARAAWPAIVGTPTLWVVFLWRYTRGDARPMPWRWICALWLPPLAMGAAAATDASHHLLYGLGSAPVDGAPGAPMRYEHGPLFWLAATYVYAGMLFGVAVVAHAARAAHGVLRDQLRGLIALTFVPWVANASYVVLGFTVFGFDPTPFSFVLTHVLFVHASRRHRLFDVAPLAHEALLDAVPDPVLVVDTARRVVGANPSARRLSGGDATGLPLLQWPRLGEPLAHALQAHARAREIHLEGEVYELDCVPLYSHHRRLGELLYLRNVTLRHRLTAELVEALVRSEHQKLAIANLQERLREQAQRDPLTGLHNRRALDEFFERECARAAREHRPIALALADLDHFKRINDAHGHAVGDEVLRGLAARLAGRMRATDGVFRFGGEEFVLLLPGAGGADALARLAGLCEAVRTEPIATSAGPLACTLSVGVAQWSPQRPAGLDQLLHAADVALYRAKAAGRDRIEPAADAEAALPA